MVYPARFIRIDAVRIFEFIDRIETRNHPRQLAHHWRRSAASLWRNEATGIGLREMGRDAINFYTEVKAVYIDYNRTKAANEYY